MCRVAMTGVGVKAPACFDEELFRNNIDYGEYAISAASEISTDRYFRYITGSGIDAVSNLCHIEQDGEDDPHRILFHNGYSALSVLTKRIAKASRPLDDSGAV